MASPISSWNWYAACRNAVEYLSVLFKGEGPLQVAVESHDGRYAAAHAGGKHHDRIAGGPWRAVDQSQEPFARLREIAFAGERPPRESAAHAGERAAGPRALAHALNGERCGVRSSR